MRRNNLWLGVAIAYHTLVNLVAALLNLYVGTGTGRIGSGAILVEAVVGIFALFSLWMTVRLRRAPDTPISV
jgi:hypothetical protein